MLPCGVRTFLSLPKEAAIVSGPFQAGQASTKARHPPLESPEWVGAGRTQGAICSNPQAMTRGAVSRLRKDVITTTWMATWGCPP